jgi:hypothetical protein
MSCSRRDQFTAVTAHLLIYQLHALDGKTNTLPLEPTVVLCLQV